MKAVTICFLSILFAFAARIPAAARQGKSPVPDRSQYLEIKILPLLQNPRVLAHFLASPEPLGEPLLVRWNSGLKLTDAAGKTLFEGPRRRSWHMPFVHDVIVVHGEPVILIGDSSSLSAIRYSSGNIVNAGEWGGSRVELQPLNNGDFKIVVSAPGSGQEDLPNVEDNPIARRPNQETFIALPPHSCSRSHCETKLQSRNVPQATWSSSRHDDNAIVTKRTDLATDVYLEASRAQ